MDNLIPAQINWVSVKDNLPETQKMVLLAREGGYRGPVDWGWLDFSDRRFWVQFAGMQGHGDDECFGKITYWAYPPLTPQTLNKEENKNAIKST